MRTTMTLAATFGCSPFAIFEQETDEVIMLLNYYLELANDETPRKVNSNTKEKRIRVNDKTATGGWW